MASLRSDVRKNPRSSPPPAPDISHGGRDGSLSRSAVEYTQETDTYRTSVGENNESVAMDSISTVAAVTETDPLDLPSLWGSIDVDALESLIEPTGARGSGNDVHLVFTYEGDTVTVHDDGIIAVQPVQEGDITGQE